MYCKKCGNKQEEGEKFCPKCGTPFTVEDNQGTLKDNLMSDSKDEMNLRQETKKNFKVRFKEGLCVILSLMIPLLGLILYFIKRKENKVLANSILACTIIGIVFNIVIYNNSDEFGNVFFEKEYFESYEEFDNEENSASESNSKEDDRILQQMMEIDSKRRKLFSAIEESYNAYRAHLANGYFYGTSPELGKLIDYKNKMEDLCDEYIRLANQLTDNESIIEEANMQKQRIMSAFDDMGLSPNY